MDGQDWALLRACLAPNVHVDYSDLRRDPPATIAADGFVGRLGHRAPRLTEGSRRPRPRGPAAGRLTDL